MTFTHLPAIASFIRNTHMSFAHRPVDTALDTLVEIKAYIAKTPAVVGVTVPAYTDYDHGEVNTEVTITRLPSGAWEYTERVAE